MFTSKSACFARSLLPRAPSFTTSKTESGTWLSCLSLRAYKQNLLALCGGGFDYRKCSLKTGNRVVEIDNVVIATLTVNILSHFRMPTACFVSEMGTSFEKLLNIYCNCSHVLLLVFTPFWGPEAIYMITAERNVSKTVSL
jgi:hypothetical protein